MVYSLRLDRERERKDDEIRRRRRRRKKGLDIYSFSAGVEDVG